MTSAIKAFARRFVRERMTAEEEQLQVARWGKEIPAYQREMLLEMREDELATETEEALLTEGLRQVDIETLKYSTRLPAGIQQINGRYYLPSDSVFTWKHV